MIHTAIIAFGSNLENPAEQVHHAISAVAMLPEITELRVSSLYRSAPVGYTNQPDFINAVAQIRTTLSAEHLLRVLQKIENNFGRIRSFQNAPRTLDLDIIDFNHEIYNLPHLILPHPRAHERSFVILPLAEIAPDYVLGEHGTAQVLAEKLGNHGIELFQAA